MSETNMDFVLRVLKAMQDCDNREELWWNVKEDGSVAFTVNCSDVFWWACADSEDVTPENVSELEKALTDIKSVLDPEDDPAPFTISHAPMLFAARMRKMQPQGAMYKYIDSRLWKLFDEAGPERVVDGANTPKPDFDEHVRSEQEWKKKREELLQNKLEVKEEKKPNIVQRIFMWLLKKLEE